MRLDFKHLEMHGFMSFDDEVFDFDAHQGMTLVTGKNNDIPGSKNGSGKSTVFASLLYVLFGQLQAKIKNENIVNRYGSDRDLRLVLDFSVDNKDYKVIRGSKKGKSSYLELYEGPDNITKSSIIETQEFLENEVLHCDITIFLRTILLSSDQNYNFYLLKKADKKDFVEKLFDISVFGEMYTAIHRDILDLDKKLLAHQNKLIVLNKSADDYETRIKTFDRSKAERLERIDESLASMKKSYDAMKTSTVDVNEAEVKKINGAIEKIETAKETSQKTIRELQNSESAVSVSQHKLQTSKQSKEFEINKHADVMSRLCDDCKVVFSDFYKISKFKAEIEDINKQFAELEHKAADLQSKRKTETERVKKFDERLILARTKLKSLTEQAEKSKREMTSLEAKLLSLKSDQTKLMSEKNPYVDLLVENKKDVEKENAALASIEAKYKYLKFAESIVSQDTLRKFIIADLITLLNNKIKTYLTKLGSKYTVVFDSDMDYEFVTDGGSCEFQNFSAGERMRIMIATSFAFRDFMSIRNGLNANILVLDEYFDSAIDATCVESIMSILKEYIAEMNQNIYVISHRSEVAPDMFKNVIQVEKTDNISKISYLN